MILELKNVHYAKSIKILHTLTTGASSILPPVIVVEYDELSASDIGKGTLIEVSRKLIGCRAIRTPSFSETKVSVAMSLLYVLALCSLHDFVNQRIARARASFAFLVDDD